MADSFPVRVKVSLPAVPSTVSVPPPAVESFDAGVRDPQQRRPVQPVDADDFVACGTNNGVGAAITAKNSMSVKTKPPTPMADHSR